jgi:hypothetical protein
LTLRGGIELPSPQKITVFPVPRNASFKAASGIFALGGTSGDSVAGNNDPVFNPSVDWIDDDGGASQSLTFPVYALSSEITVPVPEPPTLALIGSAMLGVVVFCSRRPLGKR